MESETGGVSSVTALATVSPEVDSETGGVSSVTELATDVDSRGVNPLNHLAILQSDVTDLDSLHAIAYLSPINVSNIIGHTVTYCLSEVDSALTPNFEMTEANGSLMETPRTTIDISDIAESTFACNRIAHWPKWFRDRQRCKMAMCKGISRVVCVKCHVHLCCNPKNNCFHGYHIH